MKLNHYKYFPLLREKNETENEIHFQSSFVVSSVFHTVLKDFEIDKFKMNHSNMRSEALGFTIPILWTKT